MMIRPWTGILSLLLLFVCLPAGLAAQQRFDLLLTGGRVVDGTGNPWFYADVGVRDGRIVAVGDLKGATAAQTLDVTGKLLAPGFIDLHSHGGDQDYRVRKLGDPDPKYRAAPNMVAQGVTTLVINQDGSGPWPISAQRTELERLRVGPNVVPMIGYGTIRELVMGTDLQRPATAAEIRRMRDLIRQGMREGAFGLTAGYEYAAMRAATTDEIVALVAEIVPDDGVYIVHERASGSDPMWWWPSQGPPGPPTMLDAVMETIEVAERTGATAVQTHIKARGANFWGSSAAIVQLIERARARGVEIWADHYPYNSSLSDGKMVLIPDWAFGSDRWSSFVAVADTSKDYAATLRKVLADPEAAANLRKDVAHEIRRRGDPENIVVFEYPDTSYQGKSLYQLARELKTTPVEVAIRLQLEGFANRPGGARIRGFSMSEADIERFAAQKWMATTSDAGPTLPGDDAVHARYYGTFPRKIREYALERGILSVEDAIRSMTSLPAQILGLRDRGMIREGYSADLVVLDLARIRDTGTFLEPHQFPEGIEQVLVNGVFVVQGGELTWKLPGVVVRPANRVSR